MATKAKAKAGETQADVQPTPGEPQKGAPAGVTEPQATRSPAEDRAGEKASKGEIEANPAQKYEDHKGPQRVGADVGTAYPVDGPAPKH